jgi:hypothetical protein
MKPERLPVLDRVPLTIAQKLRLVLDGLPLVTFVLLAAAYLTVLRPLVGEPTLPFYVLMAAVILMTGVRTVNRWRDLLSGVALVREDVLDRFGRSGRRRRSSFGMFAQLGRLWMTPAVLLPGRKGHRHRVTYSPFSKIAWKLEPLDDCPRNSAFTPSSQQEP